MPHRPRLWQAYDHDFNHSQSIHTLEAIRRSIIRGTPCENYSINSRRFVESFQPSHQLTPCKLATITLKQSSMPVENPTQNPTQRQRTIERSKHPQRGRQESQDEIETDRSSRIITVLPNNTGVVYKWRVGSVKLEPDKESSEIKGHVTQSGTECGTPKAIAIDPSPCRRNRRLA